MSDVRAPDRPARVAGYVTLGVGGLLTFLTAFRMIGVLREGVRYGCTYTAEGEGRGWFCADGVGYLIPVVTATFALALIGSAAFWVLARSGRAASALCALSALPLLVGVAVGLSGLGWIAQSDHDLARHGEAWLATMLIPTVLFAVAGGLGVAAASAGDAGRVASALVAASVGVALAGVIIQPGLLAPAVTSWAILVAALFRMLRAPA